MWFEKEAKAMLKDIYDALSIPNVLEQINLKLMLYIDLVFHKS